MGLEGASKFSFPYHGAEVVVTIKTGTVYAPDDAFLKKTLANLQVDAYARADSGEFKVGESGSVHIEYHGSAPMLDVLRSVVYNLRSRLARHPRPVAG